MLFTHIYYLYSSYLPYLNLLLNQYFIGSIKSVTIAIRGKLNDGKYDGWLIYVVAYILRLLTANGNGCSIQFWISNLNAINELNGI